MEKFELNGHTYNVIETKGENSKDFQYKITDDIRIREVFASRPWWVGKKFRWLKNIKIKERMHIQRSSSFDDGWSCQLYWNPWNSVWYAEEIIN